MKLIKFFSLSLALFLPICTLSYAGDGPSDSEAMTCNVIFQMTKAAAKDPKTVADADRAANLFGAYLIKKGMKEAEFIALYDKTVIKVQDALNKGTEAGWGEKVDQCVDFTDYL